MTNKDFPMANDQDLAGFKQEGVQGFRFWTEHSVSI